MTAQAPVKKDAATVLAQAREALGGEKRLSTVKNFVATGRTRQVRGDNLVPIEFEIACELPDKYVRKDEIPAQESGPTSTGFNAEELIQLPVPVPPPAAPSRPPGAEGAGRTAGPAGPPSQAQLDAMRNARVATVKQDFVRLTLGMFATSFSSYPVTFTWIGQAEAPQGTADVLDVKGPANFSAKLFVNSQTHLPIMVSWQAPAGRGRGPGPGGPPGAGGPPAGQAAPGAGRGGAPAAAPPPAAPGGAPAAAPPPAAAGGAPGGPPPAAAGGGQPAPARGAAPTPAAPVEYRLYYADYRDVDGMQWPFRIRRATGADTTEETTFDRFKINTKIDPKKFEVRK
jgi:hypothetical protein